MALRGDSYTLSCSGRLLGVPETLASAGTREHWVRRLSCPLCAQNSDQCSCTVKPAYSRQGKQRSPGEAGH